MNTIAALRKNAGDMGSVALHQLCLGILTRVDPMALLDRIGDMRIRAQSAGVVAPDDALDERLMVYIALSDELRARPDKYATLKSVCRAVYSRQTRKKDFNDTEMMEGLFDWSKRYYRFAKGESLLKPEEIRDICAGFRSAVVARVWENQFFALYDDIATPGRSAAPEAALLDRLLGALTMGEWEAIEGALPPLQRELIGISASRVRLPALPAECRGHLYMAIRHYRMLRNMPMEEVYASAYTVKNTWGNWKSDWEACERAGFASVPKARLSRRGLINLALRLRLSVWQAQELLLMAGYRFTGDDLDAIEALRQNG